MPKPISVTLLTKNSQKHLHANLKALQAFEEVVVLDNGSTDTTLDIARQYPNTKIVLSPFIGFGPLKNLAAEHAAHPWILSIDSDEVVSEELTQEIMALDLTDTSVVYSLLRHNFYGQKLIKACGWDNDVVPRLYHKGSTRFAALPVHEYIQTEGMRVKKLSGTLNHYSYDSISQLINKMNHYTTLFAQENRFRKTSSPAKSYLKGAFSFFRNYMLQRGFLFGYEGLVISFSNASGSFYKYMKLHEENQRLDISLIVTTHNWKEALAAVLKSAFAQSELPKEIIVAYDGYRQDMRALLEQLAKVSPVPLLHSLQEGKGFRGSESKNLAMTLATSEYFVIIDGAMVLHPDFIKSHRQAVRKGQFLSGPSSKKTDVVKGAHNCTLGFWREDMVRVNGFNEDFVGWGREDAEFMVRLQNSGIQSKTLKFGGVSYQLHHDQNARTSLPANDQILEQAIAQHSTFCQNGIDKHLPLPTQQKLG
jgi:glycosyltransferase involved in cell wall biosynthesis